MVRAIRRRSCRELLRKEPIDKELLKRMLAKNQGQWAHRVQAVFTLMFSALLRKSELLQIQGRDITISVVNGIRVLNLCIRRSKTDIWGKTINVALPCRCCSTPDDSFNICPVCAWETYAAAEGPFGPDEGVWKGLTYPQLMRRVRALLALVGETASEYGCHSFRRGAAQSLDAAGICRKDIMQLGRWASECYQMYLSGGRGPSLRAATVLC